ncbi:hypothetical protein B0T16DRAFT_431060 [Cercophora newfieldiana]|uniref:Riboflavin kinase n=1 Tax=Cercophora newfieldiana TaxID=92897 RepID=A0AA40CL93_9PEZI|nr:hypothetical protein B0T16DRAFT_431060 [Cercophora newfieldiana]
MSTVALIGSTGLVGSNILTTLISQPTCTAIQTISRRAPKSTSAKLNAVLEPDTTIWASRLAALSPQPTTVISALGTTRVAAGGIANQWKIDHDLNVELAKQAKAQGVKTFIFISSAGTGNMIYGHGPYFKMKQGVEDTVKGLGFEHAVVLRPGMILGEREGKKGGTGEWLNPVVNGLGRVFGVGVRDALGQDAVVIARAAVNAARLVEEGKAPGEYWLLDSSEVTVLKMSRPLLIGPPSGPLPPYPFHMEGLVIPGFGRGSKDLGIPTANLPVSPTATPWLDTLPSGVYFGWASLRLPPSHPDYAPVPGSAYSLFPMVMSIGYNPFYKNTVRSAEVHVLRKFSADFYGVTMRLGILGFIREEKDYKGLEALIADIEFDCEVARKSLERAAWMPREVGEEGTLDCGWLLRPGGEEEGKGEEGKGEEGKET